MDDTGAMLHTTHCELFLAESFLREGKVGGAHPPGHCAGALRELGETYLAAEMERLEGLLLQWEQMASGVVEESLTSP